MEFSESVIDQVFARTGGKCECTRQHADKTAPHHGGKCPHAVLRYGLGIPRPIKSEQAGGKPTADNCEIVCTDCNVLIDAEVTAAVKR